jgi:hypothetical protein
MPDNKNPKEWISRIKALLITDPTYMDWIIHPTIKIYEAELSPENFQLINALAEAIQHKDITLLI